MKILMKKFSNKYKQLVLRQEKEGTYIWKPPQCKIFGNGPLIKPLIKLRSLLMELYVKVFTGKFNMQNNQSIYFTSNLHKMLENLVMLIQRKQIYF